MLNAIITHKGNTLLLEFPCKRMLLAEHLASIGIRTQPSEIKCIDEEDAPIQVKIYGESEFDAKLASLISPENSIRESTDGAISITTCPMRISKKFRLPF